jgi:hypothetical protein
MQKECYTIKDFEEMFQCPYQSAAKIMRDFRGRITIGMGRELRLKVRGKLHVLDYEDVMKAKGNAV